MGCGASTQPSASSNLQGTSQENGRRGQHGHEKKRKQKQICRVRPVETRLALDPAAPSSKRIVTETKRVLKGTVPGVWVKPNPENPRHFHVRILGPEGCPFEGGVFALEMFLTFDYPMQPPKMHFLTRIYHPNIDRVGRICLDILKDKWSPALQIEKVCLSIQLLLAEANCDDPLDPQIAKHWKDNRKEAEAKAREWTSLFAPATAADKEYFNL